MKNLLFDNGGRPLNLDDFTILQDEIYYAIDGQFLGLPACVIAGCDVLVNAGGGYDITAGLVYVDGATRRFEGAASVSLPAELASGPFTVTETRAYQTGGSKQTMGEAVVVVQALGTTVGAERVVVQPEGVLRVSKAREALIRELGDVKMMAKFTGNNYDTAGRGKYGTNAYGWAMVGTTGTGDSRGRFPIAANTQYPVGTKTGSASVKLEVVNMPPHNHALDNSGSHTHDIPTRSSEGSNKGTASSGNDNTTDPGRQVKTVAGGDHTHVMHSTGGNSNGEAEPFSILPPTFAYMFLEWVGF
jgi:microcystin-dependent protein